MKKSLLLPVIAALAHAAHAENVMQFTGGNYVFAENGRLTFNISPKVFENRRWVYDPATDSAKTVFTLRMPLKTAHASAWHGYQAQNRQNFMFVATSAYNNRRFNGGDYEQKNSGFIQNSSSIRQFHYKYNPQYQRKTALPLVGYLVGLGGNISRSVLSPLITRCVSNSGCRVLVADLAVHACIINYAFKILTLPYGICSRAESDGYSKNEQGEYVRNAKYRVYGGDAIQTSYRDRYFSTKEQGFAFAEEVCSSALKYYYRYSSGQEYNKPSDILSSSGYALDHERYGCDVEVDIGGGRSTDLRVVFYIQPQNREEKLTMIDLENYIQEDFKQNPTPYINDKGEIGQGLRGVITLGQADIRAGSGGSDNGGTLSFYSSPYRNRNGDTVQDRVTIYPPQPHDNPKASGEAKDGASSESGVSTTINNVKVENINRPDKESESQPGENNSANNGSSGGSSSSSGGGENGQEESGDSCKNHPDSVGCAKMGDVEEGGENPFKIPTVESGISWKPDNFLPSSGVCPQPKIVQFMGKTYEFSYQWLCEFATKIRSLFIGLAAIVAGFIVFKRG